MITACVIDYKENEKERLLSTVGHDDKMLFFNSYEELENCSLHDEIEVIIGEPPMELIRKMKNLKWLQMTWAGTDKYTAHGDFPENIILTNTSGAFGKSISEYILSGILAMYRKLFAYREEMKQGKWEYIPGDQTLEGRTALIIGAGDIGCETARKLKAFDVTTWGIRRITREKPACFDEMHTIDDLDELLPKADIVIASLPGTKETSGLLTKSRLLSMKKDAFLVNVGRGTLIHTDDLVDVLRSGHLGGVILDVADPEPLPADHPLRSFDRVLITPHISGISWGGLPEIRNRIIEICCDNLIRYRNGEKLNNIVDIRQGYRKTKII